MSEDLLECDALVVGGGVIGLAIAQETSKKHSVVLIESYEKFGQETSSRNSEVIHSGIYYSLNSKKTSYCIEGRHLLYDFCKTYGVPFLKCGKFVVSTNPEEESYLEKLFSHASELGVPIEKWTKKNIQNVEPNILVSSGVYLPETGIINSHVFMEALEALIKKQGGETVYRHRFVKTQKIGNHWVSEVEGPEGNFSIKSSFVINAAGLNAANISNQVLVTDKFSHRYCRGRYFTLAVKYRGKFNHLIYPVPPKDGLGIHITIDMNKEARLGPDVDWCENISYQNRHTLYDCDWESIREAFTKASNRYAPSIQSNELSPGLIGVRPKLFLEGKAYPDFLIENHKGFIHCLGVESPGLTSALAIAKNLTATFL